MSTDAGSESGDSYDIPTGAWDTKSENGSLASFGCALHFHPGPPVQHFKDEEDANDKLVGVVVTIFSGSSYDEMFRKVKPSTVSGECVHTYSIACAEAGRLRSFLTGAPVPDDEIVWKQLIDDVQNVDADGVVFNWECCSGCGDRCFPCGDDLSPIDFGCCLTPAVMDEPEPDAPEAAPEGSDTMKLIAVILHRGHTVMCSDFSLKSLIWEWSEEHLGPNPFVKMGSCCGHFQLDFDPAELKDEEVPQQLQVVGELCREEGHAIVQAMSDTILYTVNPQRSPTDAYTLKVLTVATKHGGTQIPDHMKCTIVQGETQKKGAAGHVTLTYSSGGQLVTSMGHWIELTRIRTSFESVRRVAAGDFGDDECASFCDEWEKMSTASQQSACVQRRAQSLIRKSVPTRMKAKTKFY